MKLTYRHTLYASYTGYIVQGIVNNLPPLLFLTFQRQFGLTFEQIGLLISVNFGLQIAVDFLATRYVDNIGYRGGAVWAHVLATLGLVLLGTLPYIFAAPFWGLLTATAVSAVGGGLIEVLISPIVEALPGEKKEARMSLLHSFYCWGVIGVVLASTLFFRAVGAEHWRYLALLWAIIPLANTFLFAKVPLCTLVPEEERLPIRHLFKHKLFWIFLVLMVCSGATEVAMAQWASLFAEGGLGVSKTVGDLLGPCAFALCMALIRTFYGLRGPRIPMKTALAWSAFGSVVCYMAAVFSPNPFVSLLGCALCGTTCGLMWPGTYSLASRIFPKGGAAMFAALALAGDIGCSFGPGLVGSVSNRTMAGRLPHIARLFAGTSAETGLKAGIFIAALFPVLMFFAVLAVPDASAKTAPATDRKILGKCHK